ncbi:peptide-methionine (S)-S-oxide reductase MsrA [uncultured Paludibaculum sp.]|uniref:peptide-methionine (S)-S-oxide reductase MsrA n=1 Tax=uncultured Paludibaculum sp. TaxID=1765020 RepID=UPI002AAA8C26|nr:peptide-methionine (S)-S-oxide reductase MsrA [uncultured Paludibaculum sp.]
MSLDTNTETATLAGGCFWCLEAVYLQMRGVISVTSGYMGGANADPSYEEVCSGTTGHAEVAQLVFDPNISSYRDILEVFFAIHDPTTLNRQGNDVGTQYRSAIFFHSSQQEADARGLIAELTAGKAFEDPIVTEVTPAVQFWPAEGYHQNYLANHPWQPYCTFVVSPKVAKFRKKFATLLKSS